MSTSQERRKSARKRAESLPQITIGVYEDGVLQAVNPAQLVDYSEWGIRINVVQPPAIGRLVSVRGFKVSGGAEERNRSAHVVHCAKMPDGRFRAGLVFQEFAEQSSWSSGAKPAAADPSLDLYELLQISPNADVETIQRVYRLLAQRYHPDNKESGDEEAFKRVLQAYRVLCDPAARASYDAGYRATRKQRWKIFDQPKAAQGVQAEKRKRWGVLSLLYTKKVNEPHKGGLSIREMEDLLDCPREHLEFTLWYLVESCLVVRGDHGRYEITVKGVNEAERAGGRAADHTKLLGASPTAETESQDESGAYEYARAAESWTERST